MRRLRLRDALLTLVVCVLVITSTAALGHPGQKTGASGQAAAAASAAPTIWRDPGAVESLDFVSGPGGKKLAPKPPFIFVEEDLGGTSPKVKVKDAAGETWGVKWGSEVHSEVFATRMVWAVGYHVEASYFIKEGKIEGVTGLTRSKKYVSGDGSFTNARFELKEKGMSKQKDKESWRWDENPFVGTRELNGLKIMVMLTANWDPKDQRDDSSNTAMYTKKKTGEVTYLITDWGATMGKWGGIMSREKWDCEGYKQQSPKFAMGVESGLVKFGYDGKREHDIREGIKVGDAKWLVKYLVRITDAQIRAGLAASGGTPEEINCFTIAIRDRINQLASVANM
jgi:hypothetical protein